MLSGAGCEELTKLPWFLSPSAQRCGRVKRHAVTVKIRGLAGVSLTTGHNARHPKWLTSPQSLNAVTEDSMNTIAAAVEAAGRDETARVVVLGGEGRAFCSGADLSSIDLANMPDTASIDAANRLTSALLSSSKPVVCAMNGLAAGPMSLPTSCWRSRRSG